MLLILLLIAESRFEHRKRIRSKIRIMSRNGSARIPPRTRSSIVWRRRISEKRFTLHQRLRRERAGIVIRSHHEAVGAGAHEREKIALLHFRQLPVLRKKIAALADRTDDIHQFARGVLRFADRNDLVVTLVERGPDQVVHSRIDDHEFLVLGFA